MNAPVATVAGFDPAEIAQIELHILRWMRESTTGEHASLATGTGFNLSGLKEWEPGDPVSTVDWAQSSLTNFSPLITRQFEQDSGATIIALADESRSTLCGTRGVRIQAAITRCLAAVGLAAAFFQDRFGFVGFDAGLHGTRSARPRPGKAHVLHCLELYQRHAGVDAAGFDVISTVASFVRRPGLLVVISDFLLPTDTALLPQLERLHATHDVLLMMIDATFAYELPRSSAGWIEVFDVESGETRVLSRRSVEQLRQRVADWQNLFAAEARARGLDVVAVGLDRWHIEFALMQWVAERRLRKVSL